MKKEKEISRFRTNLVQLCFCFLFISEKQTVGTLTIRRTIHVDSGEEGKKIFEILMDLLLLLLLGMRFVKVDLVNSNERMKNVTNTN